MRAVIQTIWTVARSFEVVDILNRLHDPTILEIEREPDLPYPTGYRTIETPVKDGLIESEPDRKRTGPKAVSRDGTGRLGQLTGAEAEADAIFNLLIEPKIGDYDVARSRMLLSPTLQEAREALAAMLFGGGGLDTLTVTFAGHGAASSGSFYMAMRDSRLSALSATALSLADLFQMIAEAAPKQTYLTIDPYQSGGLISDFNVILKSEVMGEFGTPGVTLLATAASNGDAIEIGGHGVGTSALLDFIRGDIFLQDSNPALDLTEPVARFPSVSARSMRRRRWFGVLIFGVVIRSIPKPDWGCYVSTSGDLFDLIRRIGRHSGGKGIVCVFECYLDDSGGDEQSSHAVPRQHSIDRLAA